MTDRDATVQRLRVRDCGGRECRYCSKVFVPHPGFADHEDRCQLNPMSRPHITGTAVAMMGGEQ
jgi:hypothetical protein